MESVDKTTLPQTDTLPQTVVITGCNVGIGLELCRLYKQRGDTVVAVCRSSSPSLDELNVRVIAGIDVCNDDAIQCMSAALGSEPVDVLINNAGIYPRGEFNEALDFDDVLEAYDVNCVGAVRITHALRNNLKNGSKIAMISSRMGSIDDNRSGGHYAYRMSKAAMIQAGKCLALDLAERGIAVAILHPGHVRTSMSYQKGNLSAAAAAAGIVNRIDKLTLDTSGFFWHSQYMDGNQLP
eukprot:Rmarinus@m.8778